MATFEYSVDGQSITTTKAGRLVSGTIGVNTVKFTFDSSWDGLEKWATFDPNPGKPYKQPLDANGECLIPGEVMGGITLRIGAFGLADGQAYPTVWANKLQMEEGCFIEVPVSDWPEPSPVIEEILEELENKVDKPEDATPGNVSIIGSNSNIADSGISKDNLLIAPQLASNNIKTDSVPYVYRQTGGGIGVGNREYDSIVGGSVVWNQKLQNPTMDATLGGWVGRNSSVSLANNVATVTPSSAGTGRGLTGTQNGINTFPYKAGHKILMAIDVNCPISSNITFSFSGANGISRSISANTWTRLACIWTYTSDIAHGAFYALVSGSLTTSQSVQYKNAFTCDLTEMFGSTVADRLYAMETASPGSAIAILKGMFPNDTYPYTATPSLESVSGLSSHQMKDGNGNVIAEYPLDDSLTLRGVAVIDDNNNIKFDGDTYAPDGTVTRRYGIVDLGTLTYSKSSIVTNGFVATAGMPSDFPIAPSTQAVPKWVNGKGYTVVSNASLESDSVDKAMGWRISGSNKGVIIKDSTYASYYTNNDMASFKSAMSGIYLVYEKTAPTTETAEPYDSLQICDPLGTEEYVTTGIVPVGHETRYPEDAVKKLSGLPSDFSTLIAPTEVTYKATRAYSTGRLLIVNNILYKATTSIASGATLTVGTNIVATTLDEVIASL